jgi:hypothetical protein
MSFIMAGSGRSVGRSVGQPAVVPNVGARYAGRQPDEVESEEGEKKMMTATFNRNDRASCLLFYPPLPLPPPGQCSAVQCTDCGRTNRRTDGQTDGKQAIEQRNERARVTYTTIHGRRGF